MVPQESTATATSSDAPREPSITITIPNIVVSRPDAQTPTGSSAKPPKPSRAGNPNLPMQEFQVFQRELFEKEFPSQQAFISAHLQRVQHGIYEDRSRLSMYGVENNAMAVSFVAITFNFHPMHSTWHRIKRAVISITATEVPKCFDGSAKPFNEIAATSTVMLDGGNGKANSHEDTRIRKRVESSGIELLRVVKFAPHLAYGRISNETLHWNFSLNSTIGVTQPFTATMMPSTSYSKTEVVNSMLKIQGSTRVHHGTQSGKIVWSLEENKEQKSGLPREFTFAFLVERRHVDRDLYLKVAVQPTFTPSVRNCWGLVKPKEIDQGYKNLGSEPIGQTFLPTTVPVKARQHAWPGALADHVDSSKVFNFALLSNPFDDLLELPGKAVQIRVCASEMNRF